MSVNYVPIIFSLCGGGDDDDDGGVRVSVFYEHFLSNLLIWFFFAPRIQMHSLCSIHIYFVDYKRP